MSGVFEFFKPKQEYDIGEINRKADLALEKATLSMKNSEAAFNNAEISYKDSQKALGNSQTAFNDSQSALTKSQTAFDEAQKSFGVGNSALEQAKNALIKSEQAFTGAQDALSGAQSALAQAKNGLTVAKNSWNNQIAYFKSAFNSLKTKQYALYSATRNLINHINSNVYYLTRYGNDVEANSHSVLKFIALAKAVVNAILRIVRTFKNMATDYTAVKTATYDLYTAFNNLYTNISRKGTY